MNVALKSEEHICSKCGGSTTYALIGKGLCRCKKAELPNETDHEDFHILARFLDPKDMRYDTTDDYVNDYGRLLVSIVNRPNRLDRMAILLHALAEWAVAREDGVIIAQIDAWDFSHTESLEPGAEPGCPYGRAHHIATAVEECFRALTGTPDGKR